MLFQSLRKHFKWLIVVVAVTFAVGLLYVGVPLVGGNATTQAAVARVNGTDVSFEEHQAAYRNLLMQYQMMGGGISPSDEEFLQFQALDMVVNTKLILDAAKKEGIRASKAEIDAELESTKSMFGSDADFRNALRQAGLTERELRNQIEDDLIFQKAIDKRISEVEISEEDLVRAYEAVNARHILIRPEMVDGEEDWDGALARINELLEQIKNGADFAEVAREHSDDGSAASGGDLGFFERGRMVPEFEEAAFALAEGEISEPVRSAFGYHLIQVLEWRRAEGEEFEAEKESIRAYLQNEQGQQGLQEWIGSLRSEANVEIRDPLMNAFQHVMNGQLAQSITYYEEAEANNPNDGYINFSLGQVYQMLGDVDRAVEQFRIAAMKQQSDPQLHYVLGATLLAQEDEEGAIEAFLAASEWAPNDFMLQSEVLDILTSLEATEEAAIVEERIEDLFRRFQEQQELLEQQQMQQSEPQSQQDLMELLDEAARAAQEAQSGASDEGSSAE